MTSGLQPPEEPKKRLSGGFFRAEKIFGKVVRT